MEKDTAIHLQEQIDEINVVLDSSIGTAIREFNPDVMIKHTDNGYIVKSYDETYVFENDDFKKISTSSLSVLNHLCNDYLEDTGNKHSETRIFVELRNNDDNVYTKLLELLKDEKLVTKVLEITDPLDTDL